MATFSLESPSSCSHPDWLCSGLPAFLEAESLKRPVWSGHGAGNSGITSEFLCLSLHGSHIFLLVYILMLVGEHPSVISWKGIHGHFFSLWLKNVFVLDAYLLIVWLGIEFWIEIVSLIMQSHFSFAYSVTVKNFYAILIPDPLRVAFCFLSESVLIFFFKTQCLETA